MARMTQIPEYELDLLALTITVAHERAAGGDVLAGFRELLRGRERAPAACSGPPWAAELRQSYDVALDLFTQRYGGAILV